MKVGDDITAANAAWSFSGDTVKDFDNHVKKSVPLYDQGHDLVCKISDFFIKDDSIVYELGSSTGKLLFNLANHNKNKPNVKYIGLDNQEDMIKKANQSNGNKNIKFICDDITKYEYEKSDLIIAYYTVQFVRPSQRQLLIDKLYESLNWGGALLLFEKVRANDARFQDIATALYTDYKLDQGYTPDEIIAKSRSLKGILEPFSTQGNIDMLKRAGFVDILSVMKYICFEGFLAIK